MEDGPSLGQRMREYNMRWTKIVAGLTADVVRELLGEPTATTTRGEKATPSDFFREIGSIFTFPDDETDIIWMYVDPNRPRVRNLVGFRNGIVHATWRETLTVERWEELKRQAGEA